MKPNVQKPPGFVHINDRGVPLCGTIPSAPKAKVGTVLKGKKRWCPFCLEDHAKRISVGVKD